MQFSAPRSGAVQLGSLPVPINRNTSEGVVMTLHEIVSQVLNILEHEYDIEGVHDLGPPTIEEIVTRLDEMERDRALV